MSYSTQRHIVIKVGTNVLTTAAGLLDEKVMASLVEQLVKMRDAGINVILVSSGAMAAGRAVIQPAKKLGNIASRQVLAAVGQVQLMHRYSTLFSSHGCVCAQVLATKEDFRDRQHYLNMRDCFSSLLQEKIIPVVNENDVVSVSELMFTDNDELAALIALMVGADTLILLTSVDGILTGGPDDPESKVLHIVKEESDWKSHLRAEKSSFGRGGMQTKCRNAQKLATLGITTHIARGTAPGILQKIIKGDTVGTVFPAQKATSSKKRWLAEHGGSEKGVIVVNACARDILASQDKAVSLLPVGVVNVQGEFSKGDLLKIRDVTGKDVGIGIAQYASGPAREAMGKKNQKALVHYDYLYIFP